MAMFNALRIIFCGVFLLLLASCASTPTPPQTTKPVQSKPAMPIPKSQKILISIKQQRLYFYEDAQLVRDYPVSTSKFGIGNQQDSHRTPLGKHYIAEKIGEGVPLNTIFQSRINTRRVALIDQEQKQDVITSRIMWLRGLEKGVNKGDGIDSYQRYIYIHGTADEKNIGYPASYGCIRMLNRDVVELFERVVEGRRGASVEIFADDIPPDFPILDAV